MPLIGLRLLFVLIFLAMALGGVLWLLIRLVRGRPERRGFDVQPGRGD